MPGISNTQHIRQLNKQQVLTALKTHPSLTQAQIIAHTSLSRVTVASILEELVHAELVQGSTALRKERGAPSTHYQLQYQRMWFAGLNITTENTQITYVNGDGEPLRHEQIANDGWMEDPQTLVRFIAETSPTKLLGVGISVPGMVANDYQLILLSNVMPKLTKSRILEYLKSQLSLPVFYVNNAMAEAYTEMNSFSSGGLIYLVVGTSIGISIMTSHGPLHLSSNAEDIAHMPIDPNGPFCETCRQHGCLESLVGISHLTQLLGIATPDLRQVSERLLHDPYRSYQQITMALNALAITCETLTSILGRVPIVFGGRIGHLLREGVEKVLETRSPWITPIIRAQQFAIEEERRASTGAAMFAAEQWFLSYPFE